MEDIPVNVEVLTSLGIVLNELITNSVKHAFDGKDDGQVSVTAGREDSHIIFTYRDNGPGLDHDAEAKESGGFGMQLVRMTIESLGGWIAGRDFASSSSSRIREPAEPRRADPALGPHWVPVF